MRPETRFTPNDSGTAPLEAIPPSLLPGDGEWVPNGQHGIEELCPPQSSLNPRAVSPSSNAGYLEEAARGRVRLTPASATAPETGNGRLEPLPAPPTLAPVRPATPTSSVSGSPAADENPQGWFKRLNPLRKSGPVPLDGAPRPKEEAGTGIVPIEHQERPAAQARTGIRKLFRR
jgi:hypothetical protein